MVTSETNKLKQVIVHQPDDGIEYITPKKALQFLYDDIVYLPKMRVEHQLFTKVLSVFLGEENVYDLQQLLFEVLNSSKEAKIKLVDYVVDNEKCDKQTRDLLLLMQNEDLVYTLFTGIIKSEGQFLFSPLPNYVFTRDIGVIVNDHVIICQASLKARTRETLLTRCIIYYHPLFKEYRDNNKIIDLTKEGDEVTLEGGDVMMYDENHLLVGCSSRTSSRAVDIIIDKLFSANVIDNVVRVDIPAERASMHIDTLFTQISKNEFVVFAPYVLTEGKIKVTKYTKGATSPTVYQNLKEFIESVHPGPSFIPCGNGEYPYDEREQWTDGCNLLAVKEGVAIAYNRNEKTAEALKRHGYNVVDAEIVINACENGIINPDKVEKTIIKIQSTELSRARGGPHCMSFPISRANS